MSTFSRMITKLHLLNRDRFAPGFTKGMAIFLGDHIGEKIICDGAFSRGELEVLERRVLSTVDRNSVCLDVGANIGNHARFFSTRFYQVYAFEPHPRTSLLLKANALGFNITPLDFGLSDRSAELKALTDTTNFGASRVSEDPAVGDTSFKVRRMDDFIASLPEPVHVGFVKIDVEGHETQAIRGGEETLRAQHPPVAIEVLSSGIEDGSSEAVNLLRSLGYSHFYGLINRAFWTRIGWKPLRLVVRAILRTLAPSLVDDLDLRLEERLRPQGYPLLIACKGPLPSMP